MMEKYENDVLVRDNCFWVGFYDEEAKLHCNPYLCKIGNDTILIDPGSIPHFPIVMRKVIDLVNPASITAIVASHQDPDVCGNLAVVEDVIDNPDLVILAHTRSIRLLRHYGLKSKLYPVDQHDSKYGLQDGTELEFIATPHLHAPGAIMTYYRPWKALFSSDIFGGISNNWTLFAQDGYQEAMQDFHREYIPGGTRLTACMESLASFPIDYILPQHGSILTGSQVSDSINFLSVLTD
jgi:flavorubredoxin